MDNIRELATFTCKSYGKVLNYSVTSQKVKGKKQIQTFILPSSNVLFPYMLSVDDGW